MRRFRWGLGFGFGVVVGTAGTVAFLRYPFEFDRKFDVSHILELLVTIIVAFLVEHILRERAGTDRAEKELLILNAKEVLTLARDLNIAVRSAAGHLRISPTDFQSIVTAFKTLGMAVQTLDEILQHAGWPSDVMKRLKQTLSVFKDAVTGGTFPKDPIGPDSLARYEALYQTLVRQLHQLILEINRG